MYVFFHSLSLSLTLLFLFSFFPSFLLSLFFPNESFNHRIYVSFKLDSYPTTSKRTTTSLKAQVNVLGCFCGWRWRRASIKPSRASCGDGSCGGGGCWAILIVAAVCLLWWWWWCRLQLSPSSSLSLYTHTPLPPLPMHGIDVTAA